MENNIDISDNISCGNCNATLTADDTFCGNCGFPQKGTSEEKRSYALKVSSRKRLLKDANNKVKSAKTALYVLVALNVVFGIIFWFINDDIATFITLVVLAVIYLVLAFWSNKQPFAAILTGFIIYITLQLVAAVADPVSIFSGIVIKIIIITVFIKGIRSAKEAQNLLKELALYKN